MDKDTREQRQMRKIIIKGEMDETALTHLM
jgi:hypothetical protein